MGTPRADHLWAITGLTSGGGHLTGVMIKRFRSGGKQEKYAGSALQGASNRNDLISRLLDVVTHFFNTLLGAIPS